MKIMRRINKLINLNDTFFLIIGGLLMVIPSLLLLFYDPEIFIDYQVSYLADGNVPLLFWLLLGLIFVFFGIKRLIKKKKEK